MRVSLKLFCVVLVAVLVVAWQFQSFIVRSSYESSVAIIAPVDLMTESSPTGDSASHIAIPNEILPAVALGRSGEAPLFVVENAPLERHASAPLSKEWKPLAMQYAGASFGTLIAPPIATSHDPWCASELLGMPEKAPTYRYDPVCVEEPLRQGNFSSLADLMQFQIFPFVPSTSYLDVTDEERAVYWHDNEDPYIAHCRACAGSLVHKTLYRARRWWRSRHWRMRTTPNGPLERMSGSFLGIHRNHFSTRRGSISTSGFDFEPFNETIDNVVHFENILRIQLCMSNTDGYVQFVLRNEGEIVMQQQSFLSGNRCFWRTLQLLCNDTLARRTFMLPNETCSFTKALSAQRGGVENATVAMPLDTHFGFTPCYRNDISNLSRVINAAGTMGLRKNFWPFTCDYLRNTEACGQRKRIQARSDGVPQAIRVAVALAGFVRSFASARGFIYDNLIKPHDATLFGSVWNIVGRAKKTVEVAKRHAVRPAVMYNTLAPLFGIQPNETVRRLEVLEYFRLFRGHKALQANGLLHPGLYFTLVRSLLLVYDSNIPFDIVIRSRFDIAPTVPLHFTRINGEFAAAPAPGGDSVPRRSGQQRHVEYALDVGSSCHMDGVWWPQFAKFGEGKVLKHYADTRMKYFSWQVCDWMDIGTYDTMKIFTSMFDWMVDNNVHSAAQFVDHAFFLDHNLTYFPMQLYLKILRHKGLLFG